MAFYAFKWDKQAAMTIGRRTSNDVLYRWLMAGPVGSTAAIVYYDHKFRPDYCCVAVLSFYILYNYSIPYHLATLEKYRKEAIING